jgi:hypothetical protein
MSRRARPSTAALTAVTLVFVAVACSEPQCPGNYYKRGDTCYRIRDVGNGSSASTDGGGRGPHIELVGADTGDATTTTDAAATTDAPGTTGDCGDRCGAHASCDIESQECECDPGYLETDADCVRDPCAQELACGEHEVCGSESGARVCVCADGYDQCRDACVDVTSDSLNCGSCGNRCESDRCDSGRCVQCDSAAECADKTCQTKACTSGRCVYTDVTPGQRGSCGSGLVCTSGRECKQCVSDAQCDHLDGVCSEGGCDTSTGTCQSKPKSGSCGNLKICSGTNCVDSCGNGVVDAVAGEECDPKATSAGWDDWGCNSETCRRTGLSSSTSYHRCNGSAECTPNETCTATYTQPAIPLCIPKCFFGACPFPPGYKSVIPRDRQVSTCNDAGGYECWVACATDDDCPAGVMCVGGGLCAAYD